jgi:polar amino acid transport system substrate-binding protein
MIKQFLILVFVLSVSFSARSEEIIRLTTGEWTPYLSKNLKHYGLVSHIVTEAFALEGVKVEYIFRPWKRAYKEASIGKYDGSVIWTRNPEREQEFYYSDVVIEGQSVFFHMKSYPFDWKSSEDLAGEQVGGTLGYKYALLEDLEKKGKIEINRVATDEQNFRMLLLKRIHIFQQDREAGYDLLQEHFKPEEIQQITHHPKPIINDAYHLILSKKNKNNAHLLYLFNKGLKRLKENGKHNQYISESRRGKYKIVTNSQDM